MILSCVKRTNTKNTITKYTNTQIQHKTKCQKDPTCGIFLKRGLFKDLKNYIPTCQTHKYKIHKYTNTNFTVSGYIYIYIWHIWHTLLLVNCSIDKFHNLTVQAMSLRLNRLNRLNRLLHCPTKVYFYFQLAPQGKIL